MIARDFHMLSVTGKTPPTEFRIWNFGKVSTTKGDFKLTPKDAADIVAETARHGADLMIDYDHLALTAVNAEQGKAAGWFNLEVRTDGLWAVNVRWTPLASEMLGNSEFRYFSPAFDVDRKTLEIKALKNMALTNLPATRDLQPLVAASTGKAPMTLAPEELAAALTKHMKQNKLSSTEMSEKCDSKDMTPDRIEKLASGEGSPTADEHKSVSKAMGYDSEGNPEEEGEGEDDGSDAPAVKEADKKVKTPPEKTSMSTTTTSTTEREAPLDLVALTGKSTPAEQMQVIANAIAKSEAYEADHARLESMEKQMLEEKREQLIERGKAENKLTPKLIRLFASRTNKDLADFLDAAPTIHGQEVEPLAKDDPRAILTRDDIEVAELTGRDLEQKAKFLEAERSGKNRQAIEASFRVVDPPFVATPLKPRSA